MSIRPLVALLLLALAAPAAQAASSSSPPLLLRQPTVSRELICFTFAGDLWTVPRAGGAARRLTTGVGRERDARFSPDGALIAFTGEYEGNDDVYVVPAAGGMPKRLTTHPAGDQVAGWTRDGARVLFRSSRKSFSHFDRLFTVGLDGGLPTQLPLPQAIEGAYSPDFARLAYVPFSNFIGTTQHTRALKHYRGGTASPIWVATLSDSTVEKVPRSDSNDSHPMWLGDEVYFLSDRGGPVALWAWNAATKAVRQAAPSDGRDIKSASAGPDVIVYAELGGLYLFDPASGKTRPVDVTVDGDFPAARPHFAPVAGAIEHAALSPTGARAVFEAHGELLTVPVEHGDVRNLTHSPGVADRDPAWSPDGQSIAWFSDASNEYRLMIGPQDGLSPPQAIDLGDKTFFYHPVWSPDGRRIAYSDKRLNLWVVDVKSGETTRVDTTAYDGPDFAPVWSPDSRWLAYVTQLPTGYGAIRVWSVAERRPHQITDGLSDAESPAFDASGQYLYFTASTDDGPRIASSMAGYRVPTTSAAYVVVLRRDIPSPLTPLSDEEGEAAGPCAPADPGAKKKDAKAKAKAPAPVRIDLDDIDQRILALPVPQERWAALVAGEAHIIYLLEAPPVPERGQRRYTLRRFDLCSRETEALLEDVGAFTVSADGKKALYEQLPPVDPDAPRTHGPSGHGGKWLIRPVAALGKPPEPGKPDGTLKLARMKVRVDPRAQWEQVFRETVRIERDFFYDPNLHGANLEQLAAAYRPYLDGVMSRDDLTYLLADMLGELTAQHVYLGGGEAPRPPRVRGGLLGADYELAHDRYRVAHIYRGENWNPELRAPLTEPGVDVREGDYLLAVDGQPLFGHEEIYARFQETAGETVQLTVGPNPSGKGARTVKVVPIADERELRRRAWMEHNRQLVERLGHGRIAYVYLPDTAVGGFTSFNRYWFPQWDKAAAVIDERFNGGGWVADYIVDWLARPRLLMAMTREGRDNVVPQTIFGPKVMLINEYAGSGGDALPWMFRRLGLGPLVGTRTWGGLIGIGGYPRLIDGGYVTAPRWGGYNPDTGAFDIENKGVAPDVEVALDPAAWRAGHDPQLEKGVALALEALAKTPPPAVKRPRYPVYDWPTVRERARTQGASTPP